MSGRIVAGFCLVLVGCPSEQTPGDTGLPEAGPSDIAALFDGGSSSDAGLRDQGVDAGESGCEIACPQGLVCAEQRCLRPCPCAEGERCHAETGFCRPTRCAEDTICPPGTHCLTGRCLSLSSVCATANDCAADQQCAHARQCIPLDACIGHADCSDLERCAQGRCIERLAPEPRILFERLRLGVLDAHRSPLPTGDIDRSEDLEGDWGFGAALLDFDGDMDLDLFLGSQNPTGESGAQACLYRNDSLPGAPSFVPVDAHCGWRGTAIHGGFALDMENDGFHELLLAGRRRLTLQRFAPQETQSELLDLVPEAKRRGGCLVGSALAIDLNYDGLLDLIVGCQTEMMSNDPTSYYNLAFIQTDDHRFAWVEESDWPYRDSLLLEAQGNTLALGAADLDEDGLLELLVSQDSVIRDAGLETDPGGIYMRCNPLEDCGFRSYPTGQGEDAFFALMGSGVLRIQGRGEFAYFSNYGTNKLIQLTDQPARDLSVETNTDLTLNGDTPLFSWGVIVDDFDRDGLDDLFVSQGSVKPGRPFEYQAHSDALLLQRDQRFVLHSAEVGITPFTTADSGVDDYVYSSRAVLKADLDFDGYLELIGVGLEGLPRLHREVPLSAPPPLRCTLIPWARYAPGFGSGYQLLPEGGQARKWDSQGQLRSSASPFIVSPFPRGQLRFPSGALVPFDCQGGSGPFVVVEPAWLNLTRDESQLLIEFSQAAPQGLLTVIAHPSRDLLEVETLSEGRAKVLLPERTDRVMLRFGRRFVPRWFALEDL